MNKVVFLSYEAGTGGAATQQAHHINFLLEHGQMVTFVDEKPEYTLAKVNPTLLEHLEILRVPIWSQPSKVLPLVMSLAKQSEQTWFALNNPGILVLYYRVLRQAVQHQSAKVATRFGSGMLTMTLRRYLLEWATSFASLSLNDVIYVSRFTRHYWEGRYPWMRFCRARVIPNGVVIPSSIGPRQMPHSLRVGFVGRVLQEKGPRLFCEIANLASCRKLPFEFHLYGDGSLRTQLEQMYPDCVQWHGNVNDIRLIYPNIEVLLMTSPVENCPNALLEAKSYGVPVVSAPVGGIPEIVENGVDGILTSGRKVGSYLEALEEVYCNYTRLNIGCLKTRAQYSAERLIEETWVGRGLSFMPSNAEQ